ncbi:MAG TPA: cytochrome c biogenesis protein CcdA [Gaiellaceae bacterium]|nr:cytochrome c biogenesis protein CcdA [Gaiellaceae bacterium]
MDTLLAGSLAAAFAAGLVAFFAPCCASVMLPTYLAAVSGGSRFRVARLSAVYVAGVAVVVFPITLGASALATFVSDWHAQLFVLGGLMMLGVAVALWRGTMLPMKVPKPALTGSATSVFALGAFSGAATACCAPVLAGAVALSATRADIAGGLLLGAAYITGLVAPLVPLALLAGRVRGRVSDPKLTLRLGAYTKHLTVSRLAGSALFAGFGLLFIGLALTGNSDTAPAFQGTLGLWARRIGAHVDDVPNLVALPVLAAVLAAFAFAVMRKGRETREQA